jgi:outer membrane receptor protein involved in Fe transport
LFGRIGLAGLFSTMSALALAQATRPPTVPLHAARTNDRNDATTVSGVVVTTSRADLLGRAVTASEGKVTDEELKLRPAYRVGQLLESVPGLVVTAHSGEGKAYQYLSRGFNLDHGTDIANFIDDIPINRPTNAHGQGYSDLNFIIPEVLGGLEYSKGPYFPAIGDFGDVASVNLRLAQAIPDQVSLSAGTLGDYGAFIGGTREIDPNDRAYVALEASHVDGPFIPGNDFRKLAAIARFSHGAPGDGYDLTVQYYKGDGLFTTDQPVRAVLEGLIDRFGTLDPTDGNRSERLSLSSHYAVRGADWAFTTNAYYVRSRQTLWNDFTHFLEDHVNGDQEQQDETRDLAGGAAALDLKWKSGAVSDDVTIGAQARYDGIFVDRRHTVARRVLDYCELLQPDGVTAAPYDIGLPYCSQDLVKLHDIGLYMENKIVWTSWLRTDIGVREEFYGGSDHNLVPGGPFSKAPFSQDVTMFQPKGSLVLGPWWKTEVYVSAGRGFHSDDIRGVSGTVPLEGLQGNATAAPFIVQADGGEAGIRTDIIPRTQIQFAAFYIHLNSEFVYDQDQGEDQAGPPSKRDGVEFSAQYRPSGWLELNTDLSFSHARFDTSHLAAYGDAGSYIPLAPDFVGSLGVLVDNLGPWFGGLQVRILGSYPLVSDNSERDAGYSETDVNVGYKINTHLRVQAEIFNLFDVKANAAAFYYVTDIHDGLGPTADHQVHPLEPISGRFRLTATF